jgi:hypothetical protein
MARADVELGPTTSDHKVIRRQSLRGKADEGLKILQLHGVHDNEVMGKDKDVMV